MNETFTAAEPAAVVGGVQLIKFAAAFVFVICLMLASAWLIRRSGLVGPVVRAGSKKRLKVVEYLPVDSRRRLVLVRHDDREHLLLLGPEHALVVENGAAAPASPAEYLVPEKDNPHAKA